MKKTTKTLNLIGKDKWCSWVRIKNGKIVNQDNGNHFWNWTEKRFRNFCKEKGIKLEEMKFNKIDD